MTIDEIIDELNNKNSKLFYATLDLDELQKSILTKKKEIEYLKEEIVDLEEQLKILQN
jgi:hypothetical protein